MKAVFFQHPKTYSEYDYSTNTNILIGKRKLGCIALNQFYYTYQISKYKNHRFYQFYHQIPSKSYTLWRIFKESEYITEDIIDENNNILDFYTIRQEFKRYLS